MNLIKTITSLAVIKKLYAIPYNRKLRASMSDEEKDALEDAKSDRG